MANNRNDKGPRLYSYRAFLRSLTAFEAAVSHHRMLDGHISRLHCLQIALEQQSRTNYAEVRYDRKLGKYEVIKR